MQWLVLILLFCSGMNIGSKYYYFCFIATAGFILMNKKLVMDWNVIVLLILSVSWVLFSPDLKDFKITTFFKPFLYPMAYITGRNFFASRDKDSVGTVDYKSNLIPVFVIQS